MGHVYQSHTYAAFWRDQTPEDVALQAATANHADPATIKLLTRAAKAAAKTAPRHSLDFTPLDPRKAYGEGEAIVTATQPDAQSIKVYPHYLNPFGDIDGDGVNLDALSELLATRKVNANIKQGGNRVAWAIYNAKNAHNWDDPDLFPVKSAAVLGLIVPVRTSLPVLVERRDAFTKAAKCLSLLSDTDVHTKNAICAWLEAIAPKEGTRDARKARRMAIFYGLCADARAALDSPFADPDESRRESLYHATRAAYIAMDMHLESCSAIHAETAPVVESLDEIIERQQAGEADIYDRTPADRKRQDAIATAFSNAMAAMTKVQKDVFHLMRKGYNVAQMAAKMHRDESTIRLHVAAIARVVAESFADTLPDSGAARALNLNAYLSDLDAKAVAADLAARRAAAAAERAAKTADEAKAAKAKVGGAKRGEAIRAEAAAKAAEKAEELRATAKTLATSAEIIKAASVKLSPQMYAVLDSVKQGRSQRETADALGRTVSTINQHCKAARDAIVAAVIEIDPTADADALQALDLRAILHYIGA